MTFDLSSIPVEVRPFIEMALDMREEALKTASNEIKKAVQESIHKVSVELGKGKFKGIDKNLNKALDKIRIDFASELEEIIERGLSQAAYAGFSIGQNILRRYNGKGFNPKLVHVDKLKEAKVIAESILNKQRYFNKKPFILSERIWDLSGNNMEQIKKILESGIDTDCVKVAKALDKYVKKGAKTLNKDYPEMMKRMKGRVPANLSYEALRLARNELSTVYWDTSVQGYKDNPAVEAVKWLLSNNRIKGFHDICDRMAFEDQHGLGAGIFPLSEAPSKPHINCLCNIAPVTRKSLKDGVGNKPPENWAETRKKLKKRGHFIDWDELTDEQKEFKKKVRRDKYLKKKREREEATNLATGKLEYLKEVEPNVTENLVNLATKQGATLEGLDYRLKSKDSLTRKILKNSKDSGMSLREATNNITDVLRYTIVYDQNKFTKNYFDSLDEFKKIGYNQTRVKNTFKDGVTYKGVNTLLTDQNGNIFELQYHTPKSLEIKENQLHKLYEKQRELDPIKNKVEWEDLKTEMIELCKEIENPINVERIK